MRPTLFRSDVLRRHLLQAKMATLGELKRALGTQVDLTVFRKLKQLDYLTSYSHRATLFPGTQLRMRYSVTPSHPEAKSGHLPD